MLDSIADWLARITWPLVTRVMSSLGLGTVTYTGADTALSSALNNAKAAIGSIGGDVMALLAIGGFFDALSITAGGLVASLSWLVMKRFALQSTGS